MNEHNDTYLLNLRRLINFVSAKNEHQVQFRRKNHKKRALKKMSNQDESFFPFLQYLNIFTIPTQSAQILPYGFSNTMCTNTFHPIQAVVTVYTVRYNVNRISAF